jgi:hypothetical protein
MINIIHVRRCDVRYHFRIKTMFGSSLPPVGGLMSYLRYLPLLAHSGVQHILCCVFVWFFFLLCTLCWHFLWIVHFWLPWPIRIVFRLKPLVIEHTTYSSRGEHDKHYTCTTNTVSNHINHKLLHRRIYLVFCVVLFCLFTFWVRRCDVRYHFRIKTMFGSSLPPVGGLMSYLRYLPKCRSIRTETSLSFNSFLMHL